MLAVDFDPANLLAQQLGAETQPAHGIATTDDWTRTALANSEGVRVVPFGILDPSALLHFEQQLVTHANWLRSRLDEAALADDTVVLVDTPRLPSPLAWHAAATADHVLTVLVAEPVAYAALDRLPTPGAARAHYVVNAFEPQRTVQQDVLLLLRERLGVGLVRSVVHRDAAVAEALARNRALLDDAPYSQAAEDLQYLCSWLLRTIDEAHP
ncbi:cellulose synthase operon protein YhjQ [Fontimonas thermophila]|uniref:Cellulose synthase operon protein YhjQ n=1 Tax=Fontimonas thermophila TaxID=1076937 RepID=A0A1I2JF11_9GAMM|nr:cellulose synthase operon protein YhjQ [Fontimonas thermophila]